MTDATWCPVARTYCKDYRIPRPEAPELETVRCAFAGVQYRRGPALEWEPGEPGCIVIVALETMANSGLRP